jgi:hypothetical protein
LRFPSGVSILLAIQWLAILSNLALHTLAGVQASACFIRPSHLLTLHFLAFTTALVEEGGKKMRGKEMKMQTVEIQASVATVSTTAAVTIIALHKNLLRHFCVFLCFSWPPDPVPTTRHQTRPSS